MFGRATFVDSSFWHGCFILLLAQFYGNQLVCCYKGVVVSFTSILLVKDLQLPTTSKLLLPRW